jgi:monothiol glutaredoxin
MRPGAIRELSAPNLKAMMDAGSTFELIDVRTEDERAFARIEGSRLLDRACYDYLLGLDKETTIVFQCHSGVRSYGAAQHFQDLGFQNVFNLAGGIDAWSLLVDPTVPRY